MQIRYSILYEILIRFQALFQMWVRRDRIVVSTLRCGRNNPGSNPGHGTLLHFLTRLHSEINILQCTLTIKVMILATFLTNKCINILINTYSQATSHDFLGR